MKRKDDRLKMWIGALIIAIFFGSSIHVAFANEDISTLLKSWFDKKEETAISNVETTIKKEQQAQTERLKKEIKEALDDAEQRLQTFTEDEKKQRKDELKQYADSLLENMELDDSEKMIEVKEELEIIMKEAIREMKIVRERIEQTNE